MFLQSAGQPQLKDPKAIRETLSEKGTPLIWNYVGLAQGVHLAYPGKAGYPIDYDPRKRPWYTLSAGKSGLSWGNPHVDVQGQGILLPCSTSPKWLKKSAPRPRGK